MKRLSYRLATGFGLGHVPFIPGTAASLAVLPAFWLPISWPAHLLITLLIIVFGAIAAHYTAADIQARDPQVVVVDEIAGMLVAMTALPNWKYLLCAFVLFRLLDISKPAFIGWADRELHGGIGIMLDDVLAGIMACLLCHGLVYLTGFLSA